MLDRITLADMEKVAGRIAVLARELELIAPDDRVILCKGSETNGLNWGVAVIRHGETGHSNILGIDHLGKYRRQAYSVLVGYVRALDYVAYVADATARKNVKAGK
jgi:hypothetical protein